VLTYFALAFAISWSGVLLVIGGPGGIPGTSEQTERLFPFVYLAMLVGPSVAGFLLAGAVQGRAGLREFLSRLLRWQVGARWYAVAILAAPLLLAATLFPLSLASPVFLPGILTTSDKASLLLVAIMVGLGAGFFEEMGWTGFAVPGLRLRYGVFATGLIVGLLWGAWHFLVNLWGIGNSAGAISLALFLPVVLFSFLPAFRVLMVWVYDRSGSLLVAMLMHVSLTASTLILQPIDVAGMRAVTYDLVLTAAMWILVAAVALASSGQLSRRPFQRRMA
jgi:membrane protease YdiL (CAAX protease family)